MQDYLMSFCILDYMMESAPLRRTVSNEYAPTPPPPPPAFSIKPTSSYTWVKPTSSNVIRIVPSRKPDDDRERERARDYKVIARFPMVTAVTYTGVCHVSSLILDF